MQIELHYKLRAEDDPRRLALSPEVYCDPLESGENYDRDGIARFDDPVEYVDHPVDAVEWARVEVTREGEGRTVTTYRYALDGESAFWQRTGPDGGQEMCLDLRVDPERRLVARMQMDAKGDWIPSYTGMFEDQPDGSQTEERIRFAAS